MLTKIIDELFEIGAIKFGAFTLKSGIESPIYIDLRSIISYPKLLEKIRDAMWHQMRHLNFDIICGVPYTALPIATAISIKYHVPMILKRKEAKEYGTKKLIEGEYREGQKCLLIDDLITSGLSLKETIEPLILQGLQVNDIVLFLDRQQGGKELLEGKGYHLHSLFTLDTLLLHLEQTHKIDSVMVAEVKQFIQENKV